MQIFRSLLLKYVVRDKRERPKIACMHYLCFLFIGKNESLEREAASSVSFKYNEIQKSRRVMNGRKKMQLLDTGNYVHTWFISLTVRRVALLSFLSH